VFRLIGSVQNSVFKQKIPDFGQGFHSIFFEVLPTLQLYKHFYEYLEAILQLIA